MSADDGFDDWPGWGPVLIAGLLVFTPLIVTCLLLATGVIR